MRSGHILKAGVDATVLRALAFAEVGRWRAGLLSEVIEELTTVVALSRVAPILALLQQEAFWPFRVRRVRAYWFRRSRKTATAVRCAAYRRPARAVIGRRVAGENLDLRSGTVAGIPGQVGES